MLLNSYFESNLSRDESDVVAMWEKETTFERKMCPIEYGKNARLEMFPLSPDFVLKKI